MNRILSVALMLFFGVSATANATTVFFKASGFSASNIVTIDSFGSNTELELFDALGIDFTDLVVTGSFTFDPDQTTPSQQNVLGLTGFGKFRKFRYTDFSIDLAGLSVSDTNGSRSIVVTNGANLLSVDSVSVSNEDVIEVGSVGGSQPVFIQKFAIDVGTGLNNFILGTAEIPSIVKLNQGTPDFNSFTLSLGTNAPETESVTMLSNLEFSSTSFVSAVPVPAALPLLATALVGLGLIGRRKRRIG